MRTYRGIVCEKHDKYMIFITQNGEFHKGLPLSASPEIGEEVEFYLKSASLGNMKKQNVFRLTPVILASLLFIFIGTSNLLSVNKAAAAYIHLNGGHSIELAVNAKGNVVSIKTTSDEPLNFEEIEGLPIDAALNKVVSEIYKEDDELSISTKFNNESLPELKKQVENAVIELQENFTKTIDNPTEKSTNEKLEKENSKPVEPKEQIEQHSIPQNQQKNDVEQKPANSSSNENINSNQNRNETQERQENPNQSQNQEKTNPSAEKSKNEKQELPSAETPTNQNRNHPISSKTKDNNLKSENNN